MTLTSLVTLPVLQFRVAAAWLVLGLGLRLGLQCRLQLLSGLGLNLLWCASVYTVTPPLLYLLHAESVDFEVSPLEPVIKLIINNRHDDY